MAGYMKRKRMVIVKGYDTRYIRDILSDLGVEYHEQSVTSEYNEYYTVLVFKASLPLYEKLKKVAKKNDMSCVWFDRCYL